MKITPAPSSRSAASSGSLLGRLAIYGGLGLVLLYLVGALAGYYWMHSVRKNDQVGFVDVALLRWREVRRGVAVQQFAKAKQEWDAKNYQAAYLAYSSAVRNDPDNISGRLSAANFFVAAGGTMMALTLLEDGLAHFPDDRRLIEQTFDLLLGAGRDRHALELLQRRGALKASDPNGPLLQTYQILATLNAEDANAARKLLEQYPDLPKTPSSQPVVARVFWETQERMKAIEMLAGYVRAQPAAAYSAYAQLAQWRLAAGMTDDALETAKQSCAKFRGEIAPRLLAIEILAEKSFRGQAWQQAVETYLKDFSDRPESIGLLADVCGRNGWVELARTLYELGAAHQPDLHILALSYSDSLMRVSRFKEARQVLTDVESQATEENQAFVSALRHRQVIVAAALGDHEATRDSARRLAVALRSDPDRLENTRRDFTKLGILEAAAELSGSSLTAKISARK